MTRLEFNELLNNSIPLPYFDSRQVLDKERSIKQYMSYMLNRTNSMFEYENLPDTIPVYILELYLQVFGSCCFCYVDETVPTTDGNYKTPSGHYIFYGSIGGERDIYYRPVKFIVANPRIKNSIERNIVYDSLHADIKDPCIVIKSDTNYMGLLPLFSRYAAQLTENDISIRSAQINARAQTGICASTDRDAEQARKYFDDLEAGKMGVIADSAFLEGITISNVNTQSSNHIIQLIELQQYLKASWYNELGLNVNFNMKREYMSEEEIAVNTDILLPLVDDMYNNRVEAVSLINEVFGLNIRVMKSSAWANKEQEELSALGEQSIKGEMPLHDAVQNRIDSNVTGGETVETQTISEISQQAPAREQTSHGNGTENIEPISSSDVGGHEQHSESESGPVQGSTIEINVYSRETEIEVSEEADINGGTKTESESRKQDDSSRPDNSD